jgi:polyhydroxyalkanoate synthesis regulator phasin
MLMLTPKRLPAIVAAVLSVGLCFASQLRAGEELVLSDFETPDSMKVIEKSETIKLVPDHATQGKLAGKIPGGFTLVAGTWTKLPADWSKYDELSLDVYNPGAAAKVTIWIGDGTDSNSYYSRHNNSMNLPSGASTLSIPVGGLYRGEKGSGKFLDTKAIQQLVINFPKDSEGFYIDNFRLVKGAADVKTTLLIGFEPGQEAKAKWVVDDGWPENQPGKSVATVVDEHATEGKSALKVEFRKEGAAFVLSDVPADWSGYDVLAIDCFNPSDKPVTITGWFRDDVSKEGDYWKRHNYKTNVRPGQSTIEFPASGLYRGEKGSTQVLDAKNMNSMCMSAAGVTFFLDNVRMVKGIQEVTVDGLARFDFGPVNSPNYPGFTAVLPDSAYSADKGFGWVGNNGLDGRNYEQPDSLTCDFIRVNEGQKFAVDVPDGKYVVQIMLDTPNYWEYTAFNKRRIEANGKEVFSQSITNEEFLKDWFFRYQDAEDLPGTDIWQRYVGDRFQPKTFEVDVTGGKLELTFRGDSWGLTPSFMVMYPAANAQAGQQWMQQLNDRRKKIYYNNYAEVIRPAEAKPTLSDAEQADGYVLFARNLDKEVSYNSTPGGDASDARDLKIDLAACPGEYESYSFSVYPTKDCGELSLTLSDLVSADGAKISASAIQQRAIRYKFKRIGLRITSSFQYEPWLLVDFKTWPIIPNVTRQFWLTLHTPADAKAGKYTGKVTVNLGGKTRDIPVSLEVYPFQLDDPKISLGMYGGGHPNGGAGWNKDLRDNVFNLAKRTEEVLRDQKEHGMTAVTPPAPNFQGFKDGKAQFDTAEIDACMETLRKLGYHNECFTYASMFSVREGDMEKNCQQKYGMSLEQAIKLAYETLGQHAKDKNWLPMAWALADEPLIHGVSPEAVIKVFTAHRKAAPQMQFVSEDAMGDPSHYVVIPAIDIVSGNSPRYKVAEEVKKNKGRYWFNNIGTDRQTFGWFMLKANKEMGVEALFQWGYATNTGDIFYDYDGSEGDSGCAITASEGQRARRCWELIREGADDYRYVQTLLNLIDKAQAGNNEQAKAKAQEAQKLIQSVFSKIELERKSKIAYSNAELDVFKRQVAALILELKPLVK